MTTKRSIHIGVLVLAAASLLVFGVSFWKNAAIDPECSFLADTGEGEWIVFPLSPRSGIRPGVEIDARFERSFDAVPGDSDATVSVTAFRRFELSVNGEHVPLPDRPNANWKKTVRLPVGDYLVEGENRIVVTVYNHDGPPALSLSLSTTRELLHTDGTWSASLAGSDTRPARLASAPFDTVRLDSGILDHTPLRSLADRWRMLLIFSAIAGLLVLIWHFAAGAIRSRISMDEKSFVYIQSFLLMLLLALSWVVLLANNSPLLWVTDGFDAEGHLQYIQYLIENGELPGADQGWSMFQPPLYYLISAGLIKVFGIDPGDLAGISFLLHGLGLILGLVQLLALFGSIRLLFPEDIKKQAAGMAIATLIPVQIYSFQFVANDALAATLCSVAIYLCLLVFRKESVSVSLHVALGACLGLALLAKLTALVITAVILSVLVGYHAIKRRSLIRMVGSAGISVAAVAAVSGWHYTANWFRYGNPFIGNWDEGILDPWWQDPGFLTPSYLLRFGDVFTAPLFSAINSLPDGIYSTLWGDGLVAGRNRIWFGPPWDHEAMAAGYLLALVPTALIIIGGVSVFLRLLRSPGAIGFLLTGMAAGTVLAMVWWPIQNPIYSVIKAGFGLPAILCMCAFAAIGCATVAGARQRVWLILALFLGAWAMNSYDSFFISRGGGEAIARIGWYQAAVPGYETVSETHLGTVLGRDPDNVTARLGMARLLHRTGRSEAAESHLDRLVHTFPADPRGHEALARLHLDKGNLDAALEHLLEVIEVNPYDEYALAGAGMVYEALEVPARSMIMYQRAAGEAPEKTEYRRRMETIQRMLDTAVTTETQ